MPLQCGFDPPSEPFGLVLLSGALLLCSRPYAQNLVGGIVPRSIAEDPEDLSSQPGMRIALSDPESSS